MPSLLTANGNRIDLEPNRSYVLGRSPDADVVVGDMACSRQHARLTIGSATRRALFIEDMGSRNGTYVNDQRIWDRTAINDGCLIRIGASVYMLSLDDEVEDLMDTGTVAIEKLSFGTEIDTDMLRVLRRDDDAKTNFAGKLETFALVDLLQMLIFSHRSGTLHLQVPGGTASVEVRAGEIHAAVFQNITGFEALVALAHAKTGTFWLIDKARECTRTIHDPSSQLLIELCKALDESPAESV